MTILVTGSRGQLGSDLIELAQQRQLPVKGFDREQLDITQAAELEVLLNQTQPQLVINAAAYTAVDRAEAEAQRAYAINGDGPGYIARLCRERGIPMFHISTDYVFDGQKGSPYTPDDTPRPLNVYGKSKLAGEELIRNLLPRHIILRTSWVFGRHGGNFVKTVLRLASQGDPLRIVSDQHGAPTSSYSLAVCLLDLAQRYFQGEDLPWGTHHFTGRPYASWYDFAEEIIHQAAELGVIEPVDITPIRTEELQLVAPRPVDSRLAGKLLPTPRPDWRADLKRLLPQLLADARLSTEC